MATKEAIMRRRLIFTIIAVLLIACVYALPLLVGQSPASESQKLMEQLNVLLRKSRSWEVESSLLLGMTVLIGVLGLLSSTLQGVKNRWSKSATVAIGLAISVLTLITSSVFPTDYRTLRRNAIHSTGWIREAQVALNGCDSASEEDKKVYREMVRNIIRRFGELEEQMYSAPSTLDLVTSAHAFQGQPDWVYRPPQDPINLYFVGVAQNVSLARAQSDSYKSAVDRATMLLAAQTGRRPVPSDSDPLRKYVMGSSAVASAQFTFDRGRGIYQYYTLLKMNRMLTRPDLVNSAVRP